MPRSAIDSALRAFCSTSSTASPSVSASRRTSAMIWATSSGASPSEGSSSSSARGRADERAADREHLALAAGEARGRLSRCAPAGAGTARRSRPAAPPRAAPPQPAEAEVLLDRQLGDHAAALGHVGEAAADDRPRPAAA